MTDVDVVEELKVKLAIAESALLALAELVAEALAELPDEEEVAE